MDATTRGFLALTVACAQCHDHKFDPIPKKDYYSLQGIFNSTELDEVPLADATTVKAWKDRKEALDKAEDAAQGILRDTDNGTGRDPRGATDEYLLACAQDWRRSRTGW